MPRPVHVAGVRKGEERSSVIYRHGLCKLPLPLFVPVVMFTRERSGYNDRDLVPFDNGHASWGNSYTTGYTKPYSATK